tara:strand:- start:10399 stop:10983 length:585 start_codon:yes stop_codon:yes gene_type:complete
MALDLSVRAGIAAQIPKIARLETQKQFKKSFEKIKNQMISEFLSHPVTQEIKAGPNASNTSGTLGGGSGNLFSFIGFDSGSDPIDSIEKLLLSTAFTFSKLGKNSVNFSIYIPSAQEIFSITPMPWATGRSWAKGIETGISGLGYYLLKNTDSSRSGLGIQSPRKVRKKSKFKNTQYISALIKKYEKEFKNLQL